MCMWHFVALYFFPLSVVYNFALQPMHFCTIALCFFVLQLTEFRQISFLVCRKTILHR